MSRKENYESRTEQLLMPILEQHTFELWDVEYIKEGSDWYLRAYIDKPGGITIDDCVAVSRQLSDRLDETDFIEDAYILEVSSPGLGRQLKKDKDFEKCIGKSVDLRTYRLLDGKKEFTGLLKAFDKETITIEINGADTSFARGDIAIVKLSINF